MSKNDAVVQGTFANATKPIHSSRTRRNHDNSARSPNPPAPCRHCNTTSRDSAWPIASWIWSTCVLTSEPKEPVRLGVLRVSHVVQADSSWMPPSAPARDRDSTARPVTRSCATARLAERSRDAGKVRGKCRVVPCAAETVLAFDEHSSFRNWTTRTCRRSGSRHRRRTAGDAPAPRGSRTCIAGTARRLRRALRRVRLQRIERVLRVMSQHRIGARARRLRVPVPRDDPRYKYMYSKYLVPLASYGSVTLTSLGYEGRVRYGNTWWNQSGEADV